MKKLWLKEGKTLPPATPLETEVKSHNPWVILQPLGLFSLQMSPTSRQVFMTLVQAYE